jgi:uncharacterized protein (TIGR00369 family)
MTTRTGDDLPRLPDGFTLLGLGGEFVRANGPLYERFDAGAYQLAFRVERRHTNTMGICHGGMMATFCDMLLPITAFRRSETLHARFLPTVSLQIDYLAPAPLGAWVQGEAHVLRTTRSLLFAQGLVTVDGEAIARVSGVFKIGAVFAAGGAAG